MADIISIEKGDSVRHISVKNVIRVELETKDSTSGRVTLRGDDGEEFWIPGNAKIIEAVRDYDTNLIKILPQKDMRLIKWLREAKKTTQPTGLEALFGKDSKNNSNS